MKLLRVCLLLWALCPLASRAADAGQDTNPFVEGVQCNGNVAASCVLIRSQAGIEVGKELDEARVDAARLRLQTLPNFRSVAIHLIKGSHRGWVIVVIDVTEASPLTTAFAAGTLMQFDHGSARVETIAARVTDHDLFGTGKSLDLEVLGSLPIGGGGGSGEEFAARLEYRDPHLFDSRRFFFTTGAFYTQSALEFVGIPSFFSNDTGYRSGGAGVDFSVGMRVGSYSYVTFGYRYLQNTLSNDQYLVTDGDATTFNSSPGSVLLFSMGRNTEDDPAFPTQGWLLHAYDGWNPKFGTNFAGLLARATWRVGPNAYWTFQARPFDDFQAPFDDDLRFSAVYSHDFRDSSQPGSAHRARWYVGPGFTTVGSSWAPLNFEVGVKAGVRLETKYFGTVNLFLVATHDLGLGN